MTWWWCGRVAHMTCLSMPNARMHLIRVAEHLGVRLLASPPPGPQRPEDGGRKMLHFCSKKSPSSFTRSQTLRGSTRKHVSTVEPSCVPRWKRPRDPKSPSRTKSVYACQAAVNRRRNCIHTPQATLTPYKRLPTRLTHEQFSRCLVFYHH